MLQLIMIQVIKISRSVCVYLRYIISISCTYPYTRLLQANMSTVLLRRKYLFCGRKLSWLALVCRIILKYQKYNRSNFAVKRRPRERNSWLKFRGTRTKMETVEPQHWRCFSFVVSQFVFRWYWNNNRNHKVGYITWRAAACGHSSIVPCINNGRMIQKCYQDGLDNGKLQNNDE